MKRSIKLLSMILSVALLLSAAVPALAEKLTVHYEQDESKKAEDRFDFKTEEIQLAAYLIGTGPYGDWEILDIYKDIRIFDENNAFQKNSLTDIKNRIREKNPGSTIAWTRAADASNGIAEILVANPGLYYVTQINARTKGGTVRTSDMMMATGGKADSVNAKWEFKAAVPDDDVPPEEKLYKLTIHYIYGNGPMVGQHVFPDHKEEELWTGYKYNVPSGKKQGYWATIEVVTGVMPNHDVELWVYYFMVEEGKRRIPIEDYQTPLGLGDIQMHVGVCYE